jgi:oligoribonuclease NrnB/cAMP/cGMP phosphodiesterase (DHH superfamily)
LNFTKLITHANCADGIASALIIQKAAQCEVDFVVHNSAKHRDQKPEEDLLYCDFTPWVPKDLDPEKHLPLLEFVAAGTVVLDHHKSQKAVVQTFGANGVYSDKAGVSGAVLAYEHVFVPVLGEHEGFREFATLVGIQDTWQNEDPRFAEAVAQNQALLFWGLSGMGSCPLPDWKALRFNIGPRLVEKHNEKVQDFIKKGMRYTSPHGTRVLISSGTAATSIAAEILGSEVDLVVGFTYKVEDGEPKITFSTRSHMGFDCARLAKFFGGGGHAAAAGFTAVVGANPYAQFSDLLRTYQDAA